MEELIRESDDIDERLAFQEEKKSLERQLRESDLARDLNIDDESISRVLAGEQSLTPEQREKINDLWQKEIGGCSYFSSSEDKNWNDWLESKGSLTFAMNHRHILTEYVPDKDYSRDGLLPKVIKPINILFGNFINDRNQNFNVAATPVVIVSGRIPEDQCRNYGVYEFESFRYEPSIDDYEYAYALRYSNGVATDIGRDKMPSWLIDAISNVLRKAGE